MIIRSRSVLARLLALLPYRLVRLEAVRVGQSQIWGSEHIRVFWRGQVGFKSMGDECRWEKYGAECCCCSKCAPF